MLVALATSIVCDLKSRIIPNTVTYGLLAAGLLLAMINGTIISSLTGLLIMTLFVCLLSYLGGLGGGDAKLMLAISTLLGAIASLYFIALFLCIAATYSLCWLLWLAVEPYLRSRNTTPSTQPEASVNALKVKIPFAPPIACAALWIVFAPASLGM